MSKPVQSTRGTLAAINEYWFGYGSPVTIGLFRIFVGLLATLDLVFLLSQFDSWFTERGFVPAWLGQQWLAPHVPIVLGGPTIPRIDVLNGVTDSRVTLAVLAISLLAAVCTLLGFKTRISSIILAIGIVSIHHRNAIILHGGDSVLRIAALYVAIAPSGRACSVDRLIGLWRGTEPREPAPISLWPQRLMSFNIALVYFTTTWLKWFGTLWRNGTATYYPARLPEFYRFPVPSFMNEFPMVTITTYGTLATEFALATLVFFRPTRKWVLLAGIAMHEWIDYSMNIPLFSYLMISGYITFYEGDEVSAWAKRLGARLKKWRCTVSLPGALRPGGELFLKAVDPLELVQYTPSSQAVKGSELRRGAIRSIGAWWFAWLPGLWPRVVRAAGTRPGE